MYYTKKKNVTFRINIFSLEPQSADPGVFLIYLVIDSHSDTGPGTSLWVELWVSGIREYDPQSSVDV